MIKQKVLTKTGDASYIWCIKEHDGSLTFGRDNETNIAKSRYTDEKNYIMDVKTMLKSIKMYYPVYWKDLVANKYVEEGSV